MPENLLRQNMQTEYPSPQLLQNLLNVRREELDSVFEEELDNLLFIEHHEISSQHRDYAAGTQAVKRHGQLRPPGQYGIPAFA